MGDENTDTTSVETVDTTVDTISTDTVLTADAAADTSGTNTNSDVVADVAAAQAILDAGDSSAEDKTAAQAIVDAAADAGSDDDGTAPDTYADFVMPEGLTLDETALADANPIFKELGLSQEKAQKVVDLYAKQVQAGSQTQIDNFNQLVSDWGEQSKNDKEFGGDKFEENVKVAHSAIAKYGTPELKQLLNDHGVGSHPEVVRFMVRVGHTLKEDVPGSSGANTSAASDRVDILYPKTNDS